MTTKKKTITDSRQVDIITDVICNICGESLMCFECNYEGLVDVNLCGGYGSKLGDGVAYNFSICETCLKDKIFPMFQDPPKIDQSGWLGGGVCDEDGNPLDEDNPYWGLVKPPDIVHDEGEPPEEAFLDTPDNSNTPVRKEVP